MDSAADLLTTTAAAALLGVSQSRVRQLIGAGVLPSVKLGRDRLVRRADVEAARARRTTPGRPVTTGAGVRRRARRDPPALAP